MSDATPAVSSFRELNLPTPLLSVLDEVGYETPSPIQARTIPPLLEGLDVLGHAPTGTGKTAAFALPLLSRIDIDHQQVQLMILTPTRELAIQVSEALQRLDRDDEAIRELEGLAAERPGHFEPLFRVGNMLRAQERFAEAVRAYDRAFERLEEPASPHWTMHYYRGIALERSKQWGRAEADFL